MRKATLLKHAVVATAVAIQMLQEPQVRQLRKKAKMKLKKRRGKGKGGSKNVRMSNSQAPK